ncbi:hypothetical protein J6590_042814 [Homalodisca vitripennis]|nr:hypothetical protein J6590_042814 [Homalodisca vitripennis]
MDTEKPTSRKRKGEPLESTVRRQANARERDRQSQSRQIAPYTVLLHDIHTVHKYPTFICAGVMFDCGSRTRDLCSGLAFSAMTTPELNSKQLLDMFELFPGVVTEGNVPSTNHEYEKHNHTSHQHDTKFLRVSYYNANFNKVTMSRLYTVKEDERVCILLAVMWVMGKEKPEEDL